MSQGELARLVGCSRQFLNNLETGHSKELGAELALKLSDALNVSMRWIVRGDPLRQYQRLSADEEINLLCYRALTPALQKHFSEGIRSLASINPTGTDPFPSAPLPVAPPRKKPI